MIQELTARQLQVLARLGDGKTVKEIAVEIGISKKTVEYHRAEIMRKLELKNFAQLIKKSVSLGLTMLCLLLVARVAAAQTSLLFSWDNPGGQYSNIVWNVFWTANIATPTNQWPLLKTEPSPTNVSPTRIGTWYVWTNPPGQYFFTVAWSNTFWKTNSFFSAAAVSPALPPTTQQFNLGLQAP